MVSLNSGTLSSLRAEVAVPSYDRSRVTAGIVHLGVGAFHRAHQAAYIDRLMNEDQAFEWGICGVGVLPIDAGMKRAMGDQDCLYTLVLKNPDGRWVPRVIGSIVEYMFAPDDPEAVIEKMADAAIRIVSMTVTEGGYNVHNVTGEFGADNPAVAADLRPGAVPSTIFGLVTEALVRRRERNIPPFAILSCDNIQGNGRVAATALGSFAGLRDPGLGEWVRASVSFPNCMVDRITPVTTDADRAEVSRRFGIEDEWPVVCEPFTQWVLEDGFPAGRPALHRVGVQLVSDVRPYELMKLRLLNASHQALGYFGYLAGYRLVHEASQDPLIAKFLLDYMNIEASPTLVPVPGIDLESYKTQLIERFSNPGISDTLARLCTDTSDRIPEFVLPVIRENLAAGRSIDRGAAVVASWARYAEGIDEHGEPIDVVDRLKERLMADAQRQRQNPLAFIENRDVFGDLVDDARFVRAYRSALDSLLDRGARATVGGLVSRSPSPSSRAP